MSSDGVLVGGEPEAILAASAALHEVAFRTDNVGVNLAAALAPAATTVLATTPFAPVQAAAVDRALAAVLAGPGAGLGHVASAYEAASLQLRSAGQALEVAGLAALAGSAGLARLQGQRATVLASTEGVDVAREAMSAGSSGGPVGVTDTVGVREVQRPDGTTFYVVELINSPRAAASFGAHVNGWGGFAESATGMETTLRWAVATKEDAELLAGQASLRLVPVVGDDLAGGLPPPTEIAIGDVSSATALGAPLLVVAGASANLTMRREMTVRTGGGQRLAMTISGAGQIGLIGVAGTGGGASVRIGVERDERGTVTKLSVATVTEVDRGRQGLAPLEALNREATREEREWELELTPELRARADRVASALAERREPDWHDVRALTEAVMGLEPAVRTYDVRHQQLSGDVAIPGAKGGGSLGMDTARLRTP